MFGTRQTGNVHTSVRQRPIKLLLMAVAMIAIGLSMVGSDTLWALPGIVVMFAGGWLLYVGGRQLVRAMRVFFS